MSDSEKNEVKIKKLHSKVAFEENSKKEEEESGEEESEGEESEEEENDFEFDMEDMNLGSILQNFLVNEEGTNVCDTLTGIKKSIDTQNKILMKVVGLLNK